MPGERSVVGVGVVGMGAIGLRHIEVLSHLVQGACVTAVYDPDPDRVDQGRIVAPDAATTGSAQDLVARTDVAAVLVASPDADHAAVVKACIARGKPVLCEKPLAADANECLEIVELERTAGRRLVQVGFMRRFDAGYRELKRLLRSDVLGAPVMVHGVHRNPHAPPGFSQSMVFTNSASHDLDIVRWLLDDSIASVSVHTPPTTVMQRADLAPARLIVLTTAKGVLATVELFLTAGYGYDVRCEVVGERGTAALGNPAPVVTATDFTVRAAVPAGWSDRFAGAYADELRGWVAAVRRGEVIAASAWDGYLAQLLGDACWTAAVTGRTQEVHQPPTPALYRQAQSGP